MLALWPVIFRPENKQITLYSKRHWYCELGTCINLSDSTNSNFACRIIMANKIVLNHLILLTTVNVLHTFQKVKSYVFHGYFAFSSIQTVHIFIIV